MSRIRVYELAKEVGMSSKDLTDKLAELGYDIKGHSSSVDDETAAVIRKTVSKTATVERVEKRIDDEGTGTTVIRRRKTVIRRRPQAVDEADESRESLDLAEADEKADSLDAQGLEGAADERSGQSGAEPPAGENKVTEQQAVAAQKAEQAEAVAAPTAQRATIIKKAEVVAPEKPKEVLASDTADKKGPEPAVSEEKAEVVKTESKTEDKKAAEKTVVQKAKTEFQPDQRKDKRDKKKVIKQEPRKPMARVVRTIELPNMDDQPDYSSGAGKRKDKPAGRPAATRKGPAVGGQDTANTAMGDDTASARAKKKGKRTTLADETDRDERRGGKKGTKNLKFTHFAQQDFQGREGSGKRGKKGRRPPKVVAPPSEMKASKKRFKVYETISVGDLAQKMKIKASEVIAKLMGLGVMATINQPVDVETAMLIATDFGYEVEQGITQELEIQMLNEAEEGGEKKTRPPVVTVMGHVDHGKTSILDAIRKTDVALGEAGGITQHIGAYHVRSNAGPVTFVDTPGHAAFTEMRSRGAQVTDIVILVVAADDGVMDQTREAIHHAQAAHVPIIVAVNKIDKDNADVDRVKRELSDLNLVPEDWGGETIYCETSAKQNIGIDELMESIQLVAEMQELGADASRKAVGRVVEAQLHKGRGPVATVLIQEGTLHLGENFVVGQFSGKVRAMLDDKGRNMDSAGPSMPVEVQGLSGVPSAGDEFIVVTDEKMARSVSQVRALKARESELGAKSKISLDKLFEQMSEGDVQELRVVLRADVQGTLEAFAKAAEDLSTKDIKVRILHEGTGTITETDIMLASASDAIIIGFNVRPSVKVKELAGQENVDVRSYDVIYHALDDIRKAMVGMLEPTFEEEVIGLAEVRETFSVPKIGTIAGCAVIDGKILRNARVRVLRDGVVIYTGKIESLRRFKDDVKEVQTGYECGIGVERFNDIKIGDSLEAFIMNEIEATLE